MLKVKHNTVALVVVATLATFTCDALAQPQVEVRHEIRIESQPLSAALKALAAQTGLQVLVMSEDVGDKQATGVAGSLTNEEALQQLLRGSGLTYQKIDANTVAIRPVRPVPAATSSNNTMSSGSATSSNDTSQPTRNGAVRLAEQGAPLPVTADSEEANDALGTAPVVVTGSRIRGAPPASPVITLTQQQMLEAGQTNLGDVVRSIPQNFAGGQNPGVGAGPVNNHDGNATGGSSLDLRGLGPDATLTLLNGRRLSYDGAVNAVDLSSIPVAAIDRLEIVADGASALYGSDAVAGVANIILKRDYEGVTTSARYGKATEGGDSQQQYSAVGGHRWSDGGFIVTYNYEDDQPIYGNQRDYESYLSEPYTVLPGNRSQAVVVSGHQNIGSIATLSLDSLYNYRVNSFNITTGPTYTLYGVRETSSYTVSPTFEFKLPYAWTLSLNGVYGRDEANSNESYGNPRSTLPFTPEIYCDCNRDTSAEIDAEGPLVRLPGGESRLAVGAGYRVDTFQNDFVGETVNTQGSQSDRYAFGEWFFPLVSKDQDVRGVTRLSFTAASRYEHYSNFGGVETPKLSLVYSPIDDIDIKGSWGQSFKTPTMLQEYQGDYAVYEPASFLGATGYPATATALYSVGGNLHLQPERATSWDATLDWHPHEIAGLDIQASYFNIVYYDRIITPVAVTSAALSDPAYRPFITYNPSAALLQSVINSASLGFINVIGGGSVYDPAGVVALVRDVYTNATRQDIEGVDFSADYHFEVGAGVMTVTESTSWLDSRQQTTSQSSEIDLSGTVYNPPRWHSRTGLVWSQGPVTLSTYYNFLGGVRDVLVTPNRAGGSMGTVDFTAIYRAPSSVDWLRNLDVTLAIQNVGDVKPPFANTSTASEVAFHYDSTNYSAVGRLVSLMLTKAW
jgi:iron complex outermembrane receptor protein